MELERVDYYLDREGNTIVIKDMDDYHFKNAFNYFGKITLMLRRKLAVMEADIMYRRILRYELHRVEAQLRSSQNIWDSLLAEGKSRGCVVECSVCNGQPEREYEGRTLYCMVCAGTGWQLGRRKLDTKGEAQHG